MERMRKTILIVDDNEALLDALDVLLSDNYTVIPAADAYQALEILAEVEPALIFLDCFMPGYNGLQLLREIRQLGDDIDNLGVDGFLHKPFNVKEIERFASAA